MTEASDLQRAFAPAILADVAHVLPALQRLRQRLPLQHADRVRVELRLADIQRRFLPDDALAMLDALDPVTSSVQAPLQSDAIRCACHLEMQQLDAARVALCWVSPESESYSLLEGRLASQLGQFDLADERFSHCIEQTTNPEILAEALGYRVRLRLSRRQDAFPDLDRLEALCQQQGAAISLILIRALRWAAESGLGPKISQGLVISSLARLEAFYCFPVETDRQRVAPMPLVVHGVAMRHRDEPARFTKAILVLAALTWRLGQHRKGLQIADFGLRIGERLFGGEPVQALAGFLEGLRQEVGEEAWEGLYGRNAGVANSRHLDNDPQ